MATLSRRLRTSGLAAPWTGVETKGEIVSNKPKYFGFYHGPSYGMTGDTDSMMGFTSLRHARQAFEGYYGGSVWADDYQLNPDGFYVPWRMGAYVLTPGTSREDWMDLYVAAENTTPGTYIMSQDIEYRLTWGERGGIVIEK